MIMVLYFTYQSMPHRFPQLTFVLTNVDFIDDLNYWVASLDVALRFVDIFPGFFVCFKGLILVHDFGRLKEVRQAIPRH